MENEELIRERMGKTRDELTEKLEVLEQKVVSSVTAVSESVANVTEAMSESVANVTDKVNEGVESVKEAVDVNAHVERHPWLMLGGSVLCGYVLGNLIPAEKSSVPKFSLTPPVPASNGHQYRDEALSRPAQSTAPSWLSKFEPEIQHLKGLALGATLGTIREMLTAQVPPHMADHVREIVDAVTKKVGAEPLPSSDWTASRSGT